MTTSDEDTLFVPKQEYGEDGNDNGDDEDAVSGTSTADEEVDEFEVEMVLAERPDPGNRFARQYLIKWEGYPIEECTWEPLENLGDGVLQGWEEAKDEIASGNRVAFDVTLFDAAFAEAQRVKEKRYQRREAKRRRLGFDVTEAISDDEDDDGDEDDDAEDTQSSHTPTSPDASCEEKRTSNRASETASSLYSSLSSNPTVKQTLPAKNLPPGKQLSANVLQISGQPTGYKGTANLTSALSSVNLLGSNLSKSKLAPSKYRTKSSAASNAAFLKTSSNLRGKFTGKTAIRTRQVSSIIMPGEKAVRIRKRLEDTMTDPTKDPKRFHSMRVMNIARKRDLERNDTAPRDVTAIPAHFLLGNESNVSKQAPLPAHHESDAGPAQGRQNTWPAMKKVKKAVRFTEADEPPPIIDGSPAQSPGAMTDTEQEHSHQKKLSLSTYQARSHTQTVTKSCTFGPPGSKEVDVIFEDIPNSNESWVSALFEGRTFQFERECNIDDFRFKRLEVVSTQLKVGNLREAAKEDTAIIGNIAANLLLEQTALYLTRPQYSILVFPANDAGWWELFGRMPSTQSTGPNLHYLIFRSAMESRLLPELPSSGTVATSRQGEQQSDMVKLYKAILCLNHDAIRPRNPAEQCEQIFMLCFASENNMRRQGVALWLRQALLGCRIYICQTPGAWKSFRKETRQLPGTIIFDEVMAPRIRRFPGIWDMIGSSTWYRFWSLATGESVNPPRFPSIEPRLLAPVQFQLTELFPHGSAFLLTPSFVISDPKGLCDFLEWFAIWAANPGYMVITCHDFSGWILDLVQRDIAEIEELKKGAANDLFRDKWIPRQEGYLEARTKALDLWQSILKRFGDQNLSENFRRITWAPLQIHPADEQSLVNWFFWWSLQKLDHHRKFYVIGTGETQHWDVSYTFRIPNYPDDMSTNPDEEEAEVDEVVAYQEYAQLAAWKQLHPDAAEFNHFISDNKRNLSQTGFSIGMFQSDEAQDLKSWVYNFSASIRSTSWAKLHNEPVGYLDQEMAKFFDEPEHEFATFKRWLYAANPFTRWLNTWQGLFYTIGESWDRDRQPRSYTARPWLAIYRPVKPHEHWKPYTAMELFIWDPLADFERGDHPTLANLIDMQARLVDFVQREADHRHMKPAYYLKRVWLGKPLDSAAHPDEHPIGTVCRFLEELVANTRDLLPPKDFMIEQRGWVQVDLHRSESDPASPKSSLGVVNELFPKHADDEQLPEQIIFHPLRSQSGVYRQKQRHRSKCVNDMYTAAVNARRRDPDCRTAVLQYRPTTQWYADMKSEKRHVSHVMVDTWDEIYAHLRKAGKQRKA